MAPLAKPVNSLSVYRILWSIYRCLVPTHFGDRHYVIRGYDYAVLIFVTVGFPLHLLIGLLVEREPQKIFKNLTITFVCIAISVKHVFLRANFRHMQKIETLFRQLDECVRSECERALYHKVLAKDIRRCVNYYGSLISFVYCFFFLSVCAILWQGNHELLFAGWFPFDWQATRYGLAIAYQIVSIMFTYPQNITNDVYPSVTICTLVAHIRLLALRISRLGFEQTENHKADLIACIKAHQLLIDAHHSTQRVISYGQLMQVLSCSASLCTVIFYLLFYAVDILEYIYFSLFFFMVGGQLYPSCYYGSMLTQEYNKLPYAVFSSNWYMQQPAERRLSQVFIQLMLPPMTLRAGYMIPLDLYTFISCLKMAYSLLTLVLNMEAQ